MKRYTIVLVCLLISVVSYSQGFLWGLTADECSHCGGAGCFYCT